MRLSDLQAKIIINVNNGKQLGNLVDAEINNEGNIIYFVVMSRKFFRRFLNRESEITVTFKQIVKIGEDVILVDL